MLVLLTSLEMSFDSLSNLRTTAWFELLKYAHEMYNGNAGFKL
jgi:hypothetical protein